MPTNEKTEERWKALVSKKWEELEALEHGGRVLFPDAIRARQKGGAVKEVEICLRVLRKDERRKARLDANEWAEKVKIDPAKEPAIFDDMDTLCILARAIRDRKEPHDQHMTHDQLEGAYDMRSLDELWAKYKLYEDLTDPREPLKNDVEFWAAVGAMGRTRNILPLAAFESHEQNGCILRLVDIALTSPTFKSWFTQFASSTPAS